MKVVVRASELDGGEQPTVIATYADDSNVIADAHGPGMVVLTVPPSALTRERPEGGHREMAVTKLANDWRDRAGEMTLHGEAKRRIDEVFPIEERLLALQEMVETLLEHGPDRSHWPTAAQNRKADVDQRWNYVREVTARARSLRSVPTNPMSDTLWPTRIGKEK